ncbi:MAG: sulfite exporter TauE/SafE family protein [Gammaproteobacteria bacterium]|nr:sulfite exporter TauE/SafE family protein [Gammaproteobacteria bacterium]
MELEVVISLTLLIFVAALLYSSVGHAGASGYLAAMALFGLAPMEMKPAALALNILVASISTTKYVRAGCFSWKIFWPFALASVPFAYVGGYINVPSIYYKPIVGVALIYAAWRFIKDANVSDYAIKKPKIIWIVTYGAGLGFMSGLTGVGGGIFLSPLLIFLRWADVKQVSGVAAAFILVNSIAGLLGFLATKTPQLPDALPIWAIAAVIGGFIGAEYGSKRFGNPTIKKLLAIVLLVAGIKMIATAYY